MDDFVFYEEIARRRGTVVYKGRRRQTIQYVAIKKVEKAPQLQQKVLKQVENICRLNHPNCLRFDTWYETRNHIWLILEYCTGSSLYALLKDDERLPERTIKVWCLWHSA